MIIFTKDTVIDSRDVACEITNEFGIKGTYQIKFYNNYMTLTCPDDSYLTRKQAERFLKAYREGLTRSRISFDADEVIESITGGKEDEKN